MKTIFISYSSKDQTAADAWKKRIEDRFICKVFCFKGSLKPGQKWLEVIEAHLKESAIMLVLISEHSAKSLPVGVEIGLAVAWGIPIIPILLDGTNPDALSRYTGGLWGLDEKDPSLVSQFLDNLAESLEPKPQQVIHPNRLAEVAIKPAPKTKAPKSIEKKTSDTGQPSPVPPTYRFDYLKTALEENNRARLEFTKAMESIPKLGLLSQLAIPSPEFAKMTGSFRAMDSIARLAMPQADFAKIGDIVGRQQAINAAGMAAVMEASKHADLLRKSATQSLLFMPPEQLR